MCIYMKMYLYVFLICINAVNLYFKVAVYTHARRILVLVPTNPQSLWIWNDISILIYISLIAPKIEHLYMSILQTGLPLPWISLWYTFLCLYVFLHIEVTNFDNKLLLLWFLLFCLLVKKSFQDHKGSPLYFLLIV